MSKMPGKKKKYNARFPPARIKKIMQTDEEVGKVAAAVPVIISRALELFAELLLNQANDVTLRRGARTLTPSHLKFCIENEKKFDFLKEMVSNVPELQDDDLEMEGDVTPVQPSKPRSKSSATTNGRSENDESMFKEPIYQISDNDAVSPHVPSSVTSPMTASTPPILSSSHMTATTTPVTGGHSPAISRGQPHLTPLSSSKSQSTTASTPGTSPAAASSRTGAPPKRRGRPPKTNGSVGRGYPPMPGEKRKHSESHGEKRKHPESHGEKRKHPEIHGEKRKNSDSLNSEQKRKHRDKNDETDGVIFLGQSASSTSEDSGASPGCLNSRVGQPGTLSGQPGTLSGQPGTPSGQPASTSSSSPLPASFILSHNLPAALPSRTNGDAAAQARNKFILPSSSSSNVTAKETKSPSVFPPSTSPSPSSHLFSRQGSALEGRKEKCSTSLLKSKNKKSGLARSNSTTPVMARSNSTPVVMYTMSPLEDGGDTGSPLPGTAAGVGASPLSHHHTTPKSRPPSFTINLPGQGDSNSTPSISMDLDPMAAPLSAPVLPSKNSRNPIGDFRGHHHSQLDNMSHKSDNNLTSNHRSKSGKSEVVLYPRNNFQVGRGDSDKSSMTNQILNLSSRRHSDDDKSSRSSHQRPFIHSVVGSSLSRQISESGTSSSNCELTRHNAVDQSVSNRVTFSRFKPVDEDYDC